MSHHAGVLHLDFGSGPVEILNQARTIAHLGEADISCARVGIMASECAALSKHPQSGESLNFQTPSTGTVARWWDGVSGSPTSHAYGFWIEEWTGLDSAHIGRSSSPVAPRGARFSKLGQGARMMKLNVLLFGRDAMALEGLFRWLENELIGCSDGCYGADLWARTGCPDGYGDDVGLVIMSGAQLMEGLTWLEPPIRQLGCFMRRASFTIGVSDPCLYSKPTSVLSSTDFSNVNHCALGLDEIFGCPDDVDAFAPYQKYVALAAANTGVNAPVVYLANDHATAWSSPLLVAGVEDPLAAGPYLTGTDVTGRVWLRGIPPETEVMVDCARRRIFKREIGATSWETADDLIDGLAGVPSYPFVSDVAGYVIVRPTFLGNNLANLSVQIDRVHRYGCC